MHLRANTDVATRARLCDNANGFNCATSGENNKAPQWNLPNTRETASNRVDNFRTRGGPKCKGSKISADNLEQAKLFRRIGSLNCVRSEMINAVLDQTYNCRTVDGLKCVKFKVKMSASRYVEDCAGKNNPRSAHPGTKEANTECARDLRKNGKPGCTRSSVNGENLGHVTLRNDATRFAWRESDVNNGTSNQAMLTAKNTGSRHTDNFTKRRKPECKESMTSDDIFNQAELFNRSTNSDCTKSKTEVDASRHATNCRNKNRSK